ncbi:MAG: carotenoid oxygenase family protein [Acidobacteriota bacterium]
MTQDAMAASDHAPGLERAFTLDAREGAWEITDIDGEIPSFIRGCYYLNGPGRFRREPLDYRHWLDGDGLVRRLCFTGNTLQMASRFVRGTKWRDEDDAGRPLYRAFGTAFEGDRLKRGLGLESPVNVSAYLWRDHLLAFGEQGLPYELDPETLETRAEHTFGGRLNAVSPLSAHPCFDASSGEMFNFGISFSPRTPSLTLYRFGADGELIWRRRHRLERPISVHDFLLAPRHIVVYLSPHVLEIERLLDGGKSVADSLAWRPELGSSLLVFARDTGEHVATVPVGERYCLHLIHCSEEKTVEENASEEGGRLVVDVVELERPVYDQYMPLPELFVDAPRGGPRRIVLDTASWTVVERRAIDFECCPDFPAVDPRLDQQTYEHFWMLGISTAGSPGRKFFDTVAHLRWSVPESPDTWRAPRGHHLGGEPVFLGDPDDDPHDPRRGCVLVQRFDAAAERSAYLLFDAFDIAAGPRATLHLEHPEPLGFHAAWYPDAST